MNPSCKFVGGKGRYQESIEQNMVREEGHWGGVMPPQTSESLVFHAGPVPGTGVGGGQDLPPESDESLPGPGPVTDTGATAVVPGATAGATAELPGTGVRNTSNYSDFFSSCNQE